jgi:hypothetical protein
VPPEKTPVPYATWQDRQLALLLARTEQISRELQESSARTERIEALAEELGKARRLLEERGTELRQAAGREAALGLELQRSQEAAGALEKEHNLTADLLAKQRQLQEQVERLSAAEKNYAAENQALASRASFSAYEAANLRRMVSDLQHSLSWRITAPLRFLSRPLFAALKSRPAAQPAAAAPQSAAANPVQAPAATVDSPVATAAAAPAGLTGPIAKILPELRRARSIAVIPCAIPFSSVLNQRPISCARYLADHGTTVIYVAWQWSPDEEVPQAGEEVYPGIFHLPLYPFLNNLDAIASASSGKSTYICTLPSPALVGAAGALRAGGYHIHYDIMDDWEGFHSCGEAPWFSAGVERELVILSDTVTAVSDKLAAKFGSLRSDIQVVRNGYQPSAMASEQFAAARSPLDHPKVIGYFGHLSDGWFDWDTLFYAARQLPDVQFELIGWAVSDRTRTRMSDIPNIRFIGLVPQGELHRHTTRWWAGIIPFQASPLSAAVDPLKIY